MFYCSNFDSLVNIKPINNSYKTISNPLELYYLLFNAWSKYTCTSRLRNEFDNSHITLGQCSITSFFVQDIFGGEVYGCLTPNGSIHCFNVINDIFFDLTSEQFDDASVLLYGKNYLQDRNEHFKNEEKKNRYILLKNNFKTLRNLNLNHLHFNEIDSTNLYLKNNYMKVNNFYFVSTDFQTKGKGRNDRIWDSKNNENILLSILVKDEKILKSFNQISIYIAELISKFLEKFFIHNVSIKWPNDVYVNSKKICGILLEGQLPNYMVIGIGLNVNQNSFPDNLRNPATSVFLETKTQLNIKYFRNSLIVYLYQNLSNFLGLNEDDLLYINEHNYLKNKHVKLVDFEGTVLSIDNNCNIVLENNDKIIKSNTGEIELI